MRFDGEKLKAIRESRNFTQRELAKAIEISHVSICNWETNQAAPRQTSIKKLAKFFDVEPTYFLNANSQSSAHKALSFERSNLTRTIPVFHLNKGKKESVATMSVPASVAVDFALKIEDTGTQHDGNYLLFKETDTCVRGKLHLAVVKESDNLHLLRCYDGASSVFIDINNNRAYAPEDIEIQAVAYYELRSV